MECHFPLDQSRVNNISESSDRPNYIHMPKMKLEFITRMHVPFQPFLVPPRLEEQNRREPRNSWGIPSKGKGSLGFLDGWETRRVSARTSSPNKKQPHSPIKTPFLHLKRTQFYSAITLRLSNRSPSQHCLIVVLNLYYILLCVFVCCI